MDEDVCLHFFCAHQGFFILGRGEGIGDLWGGAALAMGPENGEWRAGRSSARRIFLSIPLGLECLGVHFGAWLWSGDTFALGKAFWYTITLIDRL
jgi:hypothetical protein